MSLCIGLVFSVLRVALSHPRSTLRHQFRYFFSLASTCGAFEEIATTPQTNSATNPASFAGIQVVFSYLSSWVQGGCKTLIVLIIMRAMRRLNLMDHLLVEQEVAN